MTFRDAPEALTRRQRTLVGVTVAAVAATRLLALSRSMWEWDEALFASALREYDVPSHHPHPPGFPLFIAAAKLLRLVMHSDFRALQAVVVFGAIALFPAAFFLARELRFRFVTAYFGALLFVFFPNVWFFGGTAFSDVPGTAIVITACALLLRGVRDPRAYILGAALLGVAGAFRPQALIAGIAPALLASWFQLRERPSRLFLGALLGGAVLAGSFGGAAIASSSASAFVDATRAQQEYVREVDSYHNPRRIPLDRLLLPFFLESMCGPGQMCDFVMILSAIAIAASLIRPVHGTWLLLAMFGTANVFAWLMLDPQAATRYAVGYLVMYAILAAEGARLLFLPLGRGRPWLPLLLGCLLLAFMTVRFARWTLPALREARSSSAPTAAAMEWIVANVRPSDARIHVYEGLAPFSTYYLGGYDVAVVRSREEMTLAGGGRRNYFVHDSISRAAGAKNFVRDPHRLGRIARLRYFETSVAPVTGSVRFGEGWYDEEGDRWTAWRWMGHRAVMELSPVAGRARLTLRFGVPVDAVPPPTLTFTFNGSLLERVICAEPERTFSWTVEGRGDRPDELVITTDRVANPKKLGRGEDTRDLGLRLIEYGWAPVTSP